MRPPAEPGASKSGAAEGCLKFEQCGPYTLRHGFATHALAAGLSIFELARIMGTSVEMIDRTYGHLLRDSHEVMRDKLDTFAAAAQG